MEQFSPSKGKLETWRYVRRRTVLATKYESINIEKGTLNFPPECNLIKKFRPENISSLEEIPF